MSNTVTEGVQSLEQVAPLTITSNPLHEKTGEWEVLFSCPTPNVMVRLKTLTGYERVQCKCCICTYFMCDGDFICGGFGMVCVCSNYVCVGGMMTMVVVVVVEGGSKESCNMILCSGIETSG